MDGTYTERRRGAWTLFSLLFISGYQNALVPAISAGKYPAYADYQRQVRKYLPLRKFEARSEARQQA